MFSNFGIKERDYRLFLVSDHKLKTILLESGFTFGSNLEMKVNMPLNIGVDYHCVGKIVVKKGSCFVDCLAGNLWVDGTLLVQGQSIPLHSFSIIRLCDDNGRIYRFSALIWNGLEEDVCWKKVSNDSLSRFSLDLSKMRDGDVWTNDSFVFVCLEQEIIYCEKRVVEMVEEPVSSINQGNLLIDIHKVEVGSFQKKTILKDIHLCLKPGKMYFVFGGSGAGKTTFLEAVTGMIESDTVVKLGNVDLLKNPAYRRSISFTPQLSETHYRREDTVFHTLDDALRLESDLSASERKSRILEILDRMDMSDVLKSRCSSLSGGQQKKLSIALESISNPPIMFLDEPDSGVNGGKVLDVIHDLRKIANEGKIVCAISHMPDRLKDIFDDIIIMGKSSEDCGRLCYFGDMREALSYFECETYDDLDKKLSDSKIVDYYVEKYGSNVLKGE
ncbi:MAG: ABC transporter ATP-binding protein [Bacillota bacterium]|nr:ABC transporter ATP-binding protein [Bacillota bacterium]